MALSLILGEAKLTATEMNTSAKVPGTDQKSFEELANKAKAGCPVSKALKASITLAIALV